MPKFIHYPNSSGHSYINIEDIVRFWDVGVKKFGNESKYASAMIVRGLEEETIFVPASANDIANRIYFAAKGKNP
jgi:hypothetical protein